MTGTILTFYLKWLLLDVKLQQQDFLQNVHHLIHFTRALSSQPDLSNVRAEW